MKKKLCAITLILSLVLSLCSCGGPTPTETVDTFLTAIKAQDTDTIKTVYAGEELDFLDELDLETDGDDVPELEKVLQEKLLPMLLDFDYTLENEQITDDKATVDVTLATYSFGSAFTSFFNNLIAQAFALMWSDVDEDAIDKLSATLFTTELEKLTEKNSTASVTLSLTATEDGWMIDEFDGDSKIFDGLTGGMVNAIETMDALYD